MEIREETEIGKIEVLPQYGAIQCLEIRRVLKGEDVLAETNHRFQVSDSTDFDDLPDWVGKLWRSKAMVAARKAYGG